ncbi:MAG: hypothetical protein NZZ41_02900 [Candidatus Dojkabacteria bacterium]|nr:hypothetical protein [Candidatus Dojkabacteria bacterium]
MTPEEKYERTSYASFLSRHNVINVSYTDNLEPIWYLTQNEYPYIIFNGKKVKDHKTLWISPNVRDNDIDKRAKQTSLPEK